MLLCAGIEGQNEVFAVQSELRSDMGSFSWQCVCFTPYMYSEPAGSIVGSYLWQYNGYYKIN